MQRFVWVFISVCLMGGSFAVTPTRSPCPDAFQYGDVSQDGQWTGILTLKAPHELHGLWVRVMFDKPVKTLLIANNVAEVVSNEPTDFLIKNRDVLLQPGVTKNITITVKYDGNDAPKLIEYRLNAKTVCPEHKGEFFLGDSNNKDLLASIISVVSNKPTSSDNLECGVAPLQKEVDPKDQSVADGQWPWQAAVHINEKESEYICEGTLISAQHILTAAHCVTWKGSDERVNINYLEVKLGQNQKDLFNVESIHVQPGFNYKRYLNDIAVLKLAKPVIISDYVRPVCVPLTEPNAPGEGYLIGFGLDKDGKVTRELNQAYVKEISRDECIKANPGLAAVTGDNEYCATFLSDNDVCVGDSGSVLIQKRPGHKAVWELRGLTTFGPALQDKHVCNPSTSVAMTGVGAYIKWIGEVTSAV